ncbi:SDR family oxidoreductase [Agaribacterium sp. ZY112]|uniref:SDR family oxidoreductase n=1 Tax=Agaribacterium sp. ZY112 TaxID=3233574 RepID=UPI003525F36F
MSFSVKGKVALVTGANRGIGKAIVESLIKHGASKVYLAVRKPQSTQELSQRYADKVSTVYFDAEEPASIQALADSAPDVDLLINNAGVLEVAEPLAKNAVEALQYEMNINVYGLIRMAQAFSPILEKHPESALVQLNSVASIKNFTPFTTYSASKAASYSVTQGLKDSLKEKGIQVLSVHPGPIMTDMATKAGFEEGDSSEVVAEAIVEALAKGEFHLFPDSMAKVFESEYQHFADNIINADLSG